MADSYVCSGAMMKCTMGTSPATLTVLPNRMVFLAGQLMANISDHQPMVNLAPFGLCRSLGFPPTASATAAALGTLTPMPCMHNTPAPWMPGKTDYLIKGQPALLKSCTCQCMWGGTISLINNGQVGEGAQGVKYVPRQRFLEIGKMKDTTCADIPGPLKNLLPKPKEPDYKKLSELEPTKSELTELLNNHPEWFKNSKFKKIDLNQAWDLLFLSKPEPNGYTDLKGNIYLRADIMEDCLTGFRKIQKNKKIKDEKNKERLTGKEEMALGTLWHEITHNMHNKENDSAITTIKEFYSGNSGLNTKYMETANEFVARSTLDKFFKELGGKLSHEYLMKDRSNSGYNDWVLNYMDVIRIHKLDQEKVLSFVKEGLFETDYSKQKLNLINALVKAGQENKPDAWGVHHPTEEEAQRAVNRILLKRPKSNNAPSFP